MKFDVLSFAMGQQAGKASGGGSGDGTLPAGTYYEPMYLKQATSYAEYWTTLNGERYAFTNSLSGNGSLANVYKFDDIANTATQLVSYSASALGWSNANTLNYVEFNGKIHITGGESTKHYVFDGTALNRINDLPNNEGKDAMFVQDNKLKFYSYYDGKVYVWEEATDTWAEEAILYSKYDYACFFSLNNGVYYIKSNKLYKYENGAGSEMFIFSKIPTVRGGCGDCIYYKISDSIDKEYKYNVAANKEVFLGAAPFSRTIMGYSRIWEYQGKPAIQSSYHTFGEIVSFFIHEIE